MDTTRYTYAGTDLKSQIIKGMTEREKRRSASEEWHRALGPGYKGPPIPRPRRVCFFWWR